MNSYRIIYWYLNRAGGRIEKTRDTRAAENAEEALRGWFPAAGQKINVHYDEKADEAVSYALPVNKSFGYTARKVK